MFLLYRFRSTCVANCGKQFTEKHNLTRYMKTHVQSSQTYPGNISRKEISRPDTKKRHEESHNYTITCPVWGQYFNRRENLLRHLALHERPEVRPRLKRPVSPGPSNSPPKWPRIYSPQSSNSSFVRQPSVQYESQIPQKIRRPVSYI